MKTMLARALCRILAASLALLPWQAQAGLIGTGQAAQPAQHVPAVDRGALAAQLQALGVPPQEASERVAALTDAEIADLAGRAGVLPAGGIAGLLPILVLAFLLWRFTASDEAKAEAARGKPTMKPAPEKK
jgi:hypothetical protein